MQLYTNLWWTMYWNEDCYCTFHLPYLIPSTNVKLGRHSHICNGIGSKQAKKLECKSERVLSQMIFWPSYKTHAYISTAGGRIMISSVVAQLDHLWIYQLPISLNIHPSNIKRQSAVIPYICQFWYTTAQFGNANTKKT